MAIAFVAKCLISLACLLPGEVDLRQVGKDVIKLADMLLEFPGYQFSDQLRQLVSVYRAEAKLPPESRAVSPGQGIETGNSWSPPLNFEALQADLDFASIFDFTLPSDTTYA